MEMGWLIERTDVSPPQYAFVPGKQGWAWSEDSLDAVRFARREDAEKVVILLPDWKDVEWEVREHGWG